MHKLKKEDVLTIPNLLSTVRLALIPVIIWLYCGLKNHPAAIAVLLLSGLTDIADGITARKFNMISDLGKVLDPIADKLTQAAVILCLASQHKLMIPLIVLFAVREITMLILGCVVIRKKNSVNGAKWYGKLNTVILYFVMLLLILFPGMPEGLACTMIILSGGMMILSLILYADFYNKLLKDKTN